MRSIESHISTIEKKISYLPPLLVSEVENFIDFLLSKNEKKITKPRKLNQRWAGVLRCYKRKYTSIELQKLALDWR